MFVVVFLGVHAGLLAQFTVRRFDNRERDSGRGTSGIVGVARLVLLYFLHFVVPMGIVHMGNSGRFPHGKPAAVESRYATLINQL